VLLGLDEHDRTKVCMAEAPHGTAPALEGKDVANPMAMILAVAAVLHHAGDVVASADEVAPGMDRAAEGASQAVYDAVMETVAAGVRTPDLGGDAGTTEFTDAVIERVRREVSRKPSRE
jgi:isocitrate dehydrogenase (NAD+)